MPEIVGIGAAVCDTLYEVGSYPAEDTKVPASSSRTAGGGPTSTALAAAGKLGASAAYIGQLAEDSGGEFLLSDFKKYNVDTSHIRAVKGCRSFSSVIFLAKDNATRTCVYDRGTLPELTLTEDDLSFVAGAKILMIDGNCMNAARLAAEHARASGTLVLYDAGGLYRGYEELLPLTDILIPSEEYARGATGASDTEEAARLLHERYRPKVTVVTEGKKGGIIYDGREIKRYPAFPVDAVDTNGSGDVFHGAFAVGLIKGYDYFKCCIFASAVSALKCLGVGARESTPSFERTKIFLSEKGYEL